MCTSSENDLILLFTTRCHYQGDISDLSVLFIHFKWALIEDIDQPRLDLLSLTVSKGGYIWSQHSLHLKSWPFWMGSHWRHRSGNTWSAVTDSFAWGVYLICTHHLKIWTHLLFYALLHRGLFYKRPIKLLQLKILGVSHLFYIQWESAVTAIVYMKWNSTTGIVTQYTPHDYTSLINNNCQGDHEYIDNIRCL